MILKRNKEGLFIVVIAVSVLLFFFLGLFSGSLKTDFNILKKLFLHYDPSNSVQYAVVHLRIPRLLMTFIVGASLAFAGYLMQIAVRNPLADPYILGTASGAALGANLVFSGLIPAFILDIYTPPVFAFGGALLITMLVMGIARRKNGLDSSILLLSGIALSALSVAVISLLAFLSDSESKLRTIVFWVMGSFERADYAMIPLPAAALFVLSLTFLFLHKHINILLLGAQRARNLGVRSGRLRLVLVLAASLLTALSVACCGTVGFVGLMVPHLIRGIFGVNGKYNVIFSGLSGGTFLMGADLLARAVYPPVGLPVGIITAFAGVPFFVYLLLKSNYRFF